MHFKLNNRNPYRSLVMNAKAIHKAPLPDEEKVKLYRQLYKLLNNKLSETEQYLTNSTAFAPRCEHWNQRVVDSISPVKNTKNPWLAFKKAYIAALRNDAAALVISKELGWFTMSKYKEDWLAC
jgi:hypothetical protein